MNSHCFTIDVEEYFHANNLQSYFPVSTCDSIQPRVCDYTYRLLESLYVSNSKATFFILGWVANKHPELVRDISLAGHEIASHGYMHQLVFEQSEVSFLEDITSSKRLLEDITGKEVLGYRAPSFSITRDTPWAYDCIVKAGYKYDSSLYPVRHPRYGNSDRERLPHNIQTELGLLKVLPVATLEILGQRLGVAGGAYWRHFPKILIQNALEYLAKCDEHAICYVHPWEIDAHQPRVKELGPVTSFRHYGNTGSSSKKIDYFLQNNSFTSIQNIFFR